jgi:hypothetical protein
MPQLKIPGLFLFSLGLAFGQTYPGQSPYPQDPNQYPGGQYPNGQYPPGQYPARLPGGIPVNIPSINLPKRKPKDDSKNDSGDLKVAVASVEGKLRKMGEKDLVLEKSSNRILRFRLLVKTQFKDKAGEPVRDSLIHPGDQLSVEVNTDDPETALRVILLHSGTDSDREAASKPVADASIVTPTADDLGKPHSVAVHETTASSGGSASPRASDTGAVSPSASNRTPHGSDAEIDNAPDNEMVADDQVINDARNAAASFLASLPNFLVQQATTRYRGNEREWQPIDVVTAEVSVVDGEEQYKNIAVNGRPTSGPVQNTGAWSTGEFVTTLQDILSPATNAVFARRGNGKVANRPAYVYDMKVEQPNSHWAIVANNKPPYRPAYKGSVWIDKETGRVLRIEQEAVNLPRNFDYDKAESTIEYGFVMIDGRSYLLPIESQNMACFTGSGNCVRNVINFRNYRKFGSDSNIIFDKFQSNL